MITTFEIHAFAIVAAFLLFHACLVVFCGPKRRKRGVAS
jgi:hypothetical protein